MSRSSGSEQRQRHRDVRIRLRDEDELAKFNQIVEDAGYWVIQQKIVEPQRQARITIDVEPDEKVVTVTDSGPGVDPAQASEIFDAFVTRRPAGEGHGLGLYISREVARYHDWNLDIERAETVRPGRFNTLGRLSACPILSLERPTGVGCGMGYAPYHQVTSFHRGPDRAQRQKARSPAARWT